MSALSRADREWLAKSCADSGVPEKVTDPVVITKAADVLSAQIMAALSMRREKRRDQ